MSSLIDRGGESSWSMRRETAGVSLLALDPLVFGVSRNHLCEID